MIIKKLEPGQVLEMKTDPIFYSRRYLEWCEIIGQDPNLRDGAIFLAGETFVLIEQKTMEEKIG